VVWGFSSRKKFTIDTLSIIDYFLSRIVLGTTRPAQQAQTRSAFQLVFADPEFTR
jgi:hypothetical protein